MHAGPMPRRRYEFTTRDAGGDWSALGVHRSNRREGLDHGRARCCTCGDEFALEPGFVLDDAGTAGR